MDKRTTLTLTRAVTLLTAFFNVAAAYAGELGDASGERGEATGKPGFYTDGFHTLPEVEITGYFDDNIYATKRSKESDLVSVLSPSVRIASLWETHKLDLSGGARVGRYLDISAENYEDFWFDADGQYDLSAGSQIYAGAGFSYNHESRDSKESVDQRIDEPTTYDAKSLQIGMNQKIGESALKVGITYEALDFDNVGTLFNDDRDRTVTGLGLRASRSIFPETQLFVRGILNQRDYEEMQDQNGYIRDSDGYNAIVGLIHEPLSGNKIEAYLGYLVQNYDDPRFDRLNEADFGIDFRWYPAEKTKLTGSVERSINETTELGASGYLYTGFDLQLDQKLSTNSLGYISYNYALAEFQNVGREDATQTFNLGLKYFLSPKIMLSGSYSYINNDSNDLGLTGSAADTYDYERNLLFLTLKARLAP
ncbi:MAG: outer membrane beta-barrel protein [Candidatus Thiodiazotropha sp. (ex Semelilucina semeliformis)]|nr:outer membrane beta-barrel protein [Candidatus Thiodiazotropha sp. (ex Semelilucina semeliformis)]